MPQLLWEQGQISIDWELYHEKRSEIQGIHLHCVYIIYFTLVLLSS